MCCCLANARADLSESCTRRLADGGVIINSEVQKINKPLKHWAADRTRKPLRRLGWELNGEPARPAAHPALHRRSPVVGGDTLHRCEVFADKPALQLVRTYEIIGAIVASLCSFACPGRATRRNPAPSDASVLQDRRCLVKQNLMSDSIFDLSWSATDGTAAYRCFAPLYKSFD
jgi:hypothetical protein